MRGVSMKSGLGLILSGLLALAGLQPARAPATAVAAPGPTPRPAAAQTPPDVGEMLQACSPFWALDGARSLDFAEGEVSGDDVSGAFETSPKGPQVSVRLGGVTRRYTLILLTDGECILAFGGPGAADLRRSWFGAMGDDPDSEPPPGPFQRTHAIAGKDRI
jgi:hypothetical protein